MPLSPTRRLILWLGLTLLAVSLAFTYFAGVREYNYAKKELVDKSRVMAQQIMATRHFLAVSQDKINNDSQGNFEFKGLNPARGIFLISQEFNRNRSYRIKQATFPDKVRNPRNLPDRWEQAALLTLKNSPTLTETYGEDKDSQGNKYFRYAVPLYIDDSCLGCHGGPAGQTDVAGYAKEGYKIGELRGIVSISVPMNSFDLTFRNLVVGLLMGGIVTGIVVCAVLVLIVYFRLLKPAQTQLLQSSQLAAAGRVAADVAHEINNPIGIISSRAELILLENHFPQEIVEDLQVIKQNAARVADYTRSLLSFAKPFNGISEKVDLNQVVHETVAFMEKQLGKQGISVVQVLSGSVPRVWAQKAQIQQVLLNLIGNAQDALDTGGTITLRTGQANSHQVYFEVTDNARGIPPEELSKIFQPFFSTKGDKGTGLGLTLCQRLVSENGGKITTESKPGRGTTFRVVLPGSMDTANFDDPRT